jgi:hypothetical protein
MLHNARILMANGTYKNVHKLCVGDNLASIDRTPNVVKHVRRRRLGPDENVVSIKHDAWYGVLGTSGFTNVLSIDQDAKPQWFEAYSLSDCEPMIFGLPPKFARIARQDEASFATGFVYGAFMRIGALRAYPEVTLVYDASSKVGDGILKYANKGFDAVGIKSGVGHMRRITFFDKSMWASFFALGAYGHRCLPPIELHALHPFATGLNTGIVASGYAGLPPLGDALYETFYWSCLNSDKPLCYGQHLYMHNNNVYNACYGKVLAIEQGIEAYLWDVYVEESQTTMTNPSIIANNMVLSAANNVV